MLGKAPSWPQSPKMGTGSAKFSSSTLRSELSGWVKLGAHLSCNSRCPLPELGSSASGASPSALCQCHWSKAKPSLRSWLPTPCSSVEVDTPLARGSRSVHGSTPGCPSCRNGLPWSRSCCKWSRWSSSDDRQSLGRAWPFQRRRCQGGSGHISAQRTFWKQTGESEFQLLRAVPISHLQRRGLVCRGQRLTLECWLRATLDINFICTVTYSGSGEHEEKHPYTKVRRIEELSFNVI